MDVWLSNFVSAGRLTMIRPPAGRDLPRRRLIFGIGGHHHSHRYEAGRSFWMFEMTNENFARLFTGLTIAVGNRKNRIAIYQFLAAEIRALHYSYGVGDDESYKRTVKFLEDC